ncbi:RNA-guided endonuclease TnpB family protein [Halococcus salifodinae]|uniref:IS1341-type transposase n=1 Tax=Halococcus salifodinae DSM 8989 TaxID=1227456 RepID=M0N3L3_9EURY|nr:RNA-guided endonuclease TnpB family protein [Halococcus salifodinae]EMA51709.1 IS1341-type transposase [Halococcus salifodinae DSM 8989]
MSEVTKTLELKLVSPNTHKRRKLRETTDAYRAALHAAFDAGCSTQSAANDVVVEYNLSGYAKNALKKYVPQLCGGSYHADELHDEHPVRFTNEGVKLDHKPQNTVEWYVKVPHHDDYHLWVPAQPNPEQRPWVEAVFAGDANMGECRLFDRDGEWYLHIVTTREVEERSTDSVSDETPIGVDIGDSALLTVCHRDERGTPTAPTLWNDEGKDVRRLRKTYFTTTRRLQERGSERIAESFGDQLWRQIDHILHSVTDAVVEHAASVENPVLVLEDLTYIRESMDYGAYMNRRLHGWGFAKMHAQLCYKAAERGIPVETVNPAYTSKSCHVCGETGYRPEQAEFRCTNEECWLTSYQADVNAALNIADRYSSGESRSREHTDGDDSAGDGARLTAPQDSQADGETHQQTPGTYAS